MAASILPGATASIAAVTYMQTWLDAGSVKNAVPAVIAKCNPDRLVGMLFKLRDPSMLQVAAKHLICTRLAFLDALHADRAGVGAILVYGSVLMPFAVRLCYSAASPNRATALQPVLAILALLLSSYDALLVGRGFGFFAIPLIALLYTLGARLGAANAERRKEVPAMPAPTRAIYGANIAILICTVLVGMSSMHDPASDSESYWWEAYASADIRALVKPVMGALIDLLPLVAAAPLFLLGMADAEQPKDKAAADKILRQYHPEEVAYGFERTWAYYRQAGLISAASYLFGVSMIVRCIVQDRTMPSPSSIYLLQASAVIALAHMCLAVADATTAPAPDALDQEGREAIAKAPAGNPGLEDNPKWLAVLALFGGPSLSLMLWHAHIEEFRGWKGRRAWRTVVASKAK